MPLSIDNVSTYDKYDFSVHSGLFDQVLVAQSVCNNMKLLTHDKAIKLYNIGFIELF